MLLTYQKLLSLVPKQSNDEKKVKRIIETFPQKPLWNKELMACMRYFTPLSMKYIAKYEKRVSISKILGSPFMNLKEKTTALIPKYSLLSKVYETMLTYDFRNNMDFEGIPKNFVQKRIQTDWVHRHETCVVWVSS